MADKLPMLNASTLPLPRLELCWKETKQAGRWICWYRLCWPCPAEDIRTTNRRPWIWKTLGRTKVDTGSGLWTPYRAADEIDTPFRDGVHIRRDAAMLRLPAYVVHEHRAQQLVPIYDEVQPL